MVWPGFTFLIALILLSFSASIASAEDWDRFLARTKDRAVQEGISQPVIEDAFEGLEVDPSVIELDQKQPEGKITFSKYLSNTITPRRVRIGRELLQEYKEELREISRQYHVQPRFIVALWGIESDYGNNKGDFSAIQSLATLAYEGRRAEFFSNELMQALKILDGEHMASMDLTGSWAGAMGDCQFMPSTFLKYAVDANKDGIRDIWNTPVDIFASIANYLHSIGWQGGHGWGRAVNVPDDFTEAEADIKHGRTAAEWRKRGLVLTDGEKLPNNATMLYAIYPGSVEEGAYVVTENFQVLLEWNRSRYFATAVGMLADEIGE